MNLSSKAADGGSVKGFLRSAIERGRYARAEAVVSKLLQGCHPGNVLEYSAEVAGNELVQGMFRALMRAFRDLVPATPVTILIRNVTAALHTTFPRLSSEARRDLRAALFLASMGLEKIAPEDISAALAGLLETEAEKFPVSVRQCVGLLAVIVLTGLLPFGDPETGARAARELWRLARTGEDKEMIHDAWDLAVASEADLEKGEPVPFLPKQLAIG